MALQATYKQFLAAPNTSFLSPDASIHYITTLVTFNGASAIIKHLNGQVHDLKKKEEKFLDVVEGANALAVEVHTTIEFVSGGGSYLPGLDDNFLADHTVTLPIVCISPALAAKLHRDRGTR
jgi:acetyl esterase/lipase